jgi:hypothetical protein
MSRPEIELNNLGGPCSLLLLRFKSRHLANVSRVAGCAERRALPFRQPSSAQANVRRRPGGRAVAAVVFQPCSQLGGSQSNSAHLRAAGKPESRGEGLVFRFPKPKVAGSTPVVRLHEIPANRDCNFVTNRYEVCGNGPGQRFGQFEGAD